MLENNEKDSDEIVQLSKGVAMMVMGAGMILANPGVRRLLLSSLASAVPEGENPVEAGLAGILPDVERYMKIRSM
jgi:hypothetical protein